VGFYQLLRHNIGSYPALGNSLIGLAERAHSFRLFAQVRACGQMLVRLPLAPYQAIGGYFLGVAANRKGSGNRDEARRWFERVAATAPEAYRAKALASLGALAFHERDYQGALRLYAEAIGAGGLSAASLVAARGIATVKSLEGAHGSAIADLERVLGMARHAPGHIYYDLLNSYAVELGEVGRKEEARQVIRQVLLTPYALAYPEWRETAEDLKPTRRSSVMVMTTPDHAPRQADYRTAAAIAATAASPDNVLALPGREPDKPAPLPPQRARVLNFVKLKKKMAKKVEEKQAAPCLDDMSLQDLWFKLIEIVTEYQATEAQMRAILYFTVNLFSTPERPDKPSA